MAAGQWWIVREGTLGQIVSSFAPSQFFDLSVQWTVKQSATRPNASAKGPYPSQAAARQAADQLNSQESGLGPAAAAAAKAAASAAATATGTTGLVSRLEQGSTWVRVGEVLLGVLLIGIGLAHLTGAQNLISKAVKAAPIA